ncbi:MAG: hypothetical protein CBC16_06835 [Verrucomicrobia bacterium TMED56]|nr:MAG: hypothetical protein CBC16_06835 [Verrucomicrobia bacterium TMED56]
MKDDMQYINVEGSGGLVRDKETGAILNTNKSEIERARQRKLLSKRKTEEFNSMKDDIKNLKEDIGEMKSLLTKLADGW